MKKLLASTLVFGAVIAASSSAQAGDFTPWFQTSRAGGFLDMWPAKINDRTDFFAMMFGADLQFRVAKKVYLDMSFTGAYVDIDPHLPGSHLQQAAYGNPTFGAHYATDITPSFALYAGGSLTPPILQDPDNNVAGTAITASVIRGYWDIDRLTPGYFSIRGAVGIEWEIIRHLYLRADIRPLVLINSNSRFRGNFVGVGAADGHFFLEQAAEVEYRLDNGFGFGARLQAVALFTENDKFQSLLEPFITLTPRTRGFYLRLGFPLALDEPLGFGFDRGKLAAIRLSLGGQW